MITLPALQSWLGQELEMRGIDAVIYTRYILSILQQDSFEPDADFDPFFPQKEVRSTKARFQQRKFRKSWTADDWKKYAVLECLQAVTDKDCGIESLVEELCVKLKRVKEERDRGTTDGPSTSDEDRKSTSPVKLGSRPSQHENPDTQAAKYYQAFPALSDKTNTMLTSDTKPHGAWGTNKKSPSPDSEREVAKRDRRAVKSVSAASSRGSNSPTRKHQRTKSLPNSISQQDESPAAFVVPKYQTKKGYGKRQAEGKPSAPRSGDRMGRVGERVGAVMKQAGHTAKSQQQHQQQQQQQQQWDMRDETIEVLNVTPSQSPEFEESVEEDIVVDEREISWYTEPVVAVLDQGKMQSKLKTVYQSGSSSPCVKTPASDISLEEAVNSLAESLCRDIFEDDQLIRGEIPSEDGSLSTQEVCGATCSPHIAQELTSVQSVLEGDSAERGRHGGKPDLLSLLDSSKPDLYASQGRKISALQAMPLLVVDSQASLSMQRDLLEKEFDECKAHQTATLSASSSQEHLEGHATDLMSAAYPMACIWDRELPSAKEPWERSPINTGLPEREKEQGRDDSYDRGLHELAKTGNVQNLPEALKVMVDHDKVVQSPVGSLREEESLLRICCPTHSHHQCSALISQYRPGHFPFSEEVFGQEAQLPSPNSVLSYSDPGSPFYSESDQDSLAKGIKSAYHLDESTPTAAEPQPLDINSALWSTYDVQPQYSHPPKIVHWEDGSFARDGALRRRKSSFIEGGVYGSPYSSQNNSHYNSCSTSPCESGSLRDLWNPAAVQEVSALVSSMHELISPDSGSTSRKAESRLSNASSKRGVATPELVLDSSQQDEQSLIEDSLMDSPVFICSRSSSRFEFARSVSDLDGSLSPASAVGTETDEMVSEAELLEEALRDVGEMEESQECNKKEDVCQLGTKEDGEWSDLHKHSFPTDGSSQELTPSWLTPPLQDGASGSADELCSERSQGSLSLTGIVPTISKPEAVRKGKRHFDLAVGGSSPLRQKVEQGDGSLAIDELLISPKTHFRPIHETISPDDSSGDEANRDTSRGTLDSPHPGSLGESSISKVVGSAPRKSPSSDQWLSAKPVLLAAEPTRFPTGQDDGTYVKGQAAPSIHLQSRHAVKYENLPWISGERGGDWAWKDHGGIHEEAPLPAEFDPMMHPDCDNQMFAFEDEAFLQGEGLSAAGGGTFKPLYSTELEEMWLGEAAGDASQGRPPWRKHRRKTGTHKKPCTYFLEGKCRRAECPFAHDVSRIPCRFWDEGQCLKGQECPFMHGYPSEMHGSVDRFSPIAKSGHAEFSRRSRGRDDANDETRWTQAEVNPSSPVLTTEGAVPSPIRNHNTNKLGQPLSDASPNHVRSLPIRILTKPR